MIETREIDPQDHRALFRRIVEDRRAGRIGADYPAWFHLMARLLEAEVKGKGNAVLYYGAFRVQVSVMIESRDYGWEGQVVCTVPRALFCKFTPAGHFVAWPKDLGVREDELAAYKKWREIQTICREIYGDCESHLGFSYSNEVANYTGPDAECIRVESSIHWRRGRG